MIVRRRLKVAIIRVRNVVLLPWAALFVALTRVLRPFVLIRLHRVPAQRIGHFAANIELYLCERDHGINRPANAWRDVSYYIGAVSNSQLAEMWERTLRIWPEWLFYPVDWLNRRVPGGPAHDAGDNTQHDRDVHNLLERTPPHLSFTDDEEARGMAGLRALGIPDGAEFVCFAARDSAYLQQAADAHDFAYHDYRNVDIAHYVQAAEAVGNLGPYVIRMGSVVRAPLLSSHPKVIDYATSGQRTDFMDIYLGAKCLFCLSCGTGIDAVPVIFRRPGAFVNFVPIGYLMTSLPGTVAISKHLWLTTESRRLTLTETFEYGVGFSLRASEYAARHIRVIENTPEEITEVATEMLLRLKGGWQPADGDEELQQRFWSLYPLDSKTPNGRPLHGAARARVGAAFLRENTDWLQ